MKKINSKNQQNTIRYNIDDDEDDASETDAYMIGCLCASVVAFQALLSMATQF